MTMESACAGLVGKLKEWRRELEALGTALTDHPLDRPAALIDDFADAVLQVQGWLEGAVGEAEKCAEAGNETAMKEALKKGLPRVHREFAKATDDFFSTLGDPERDYELRRLALRGGEWVGWSRAVRRALGGCGKLIARAATALGECWCALLERMAVPPAMQQNVTIYQTERRNESVGMQPS